MSVEKERVSVTLTEPYLDFLNRLVQRGIHINRGAAIREALRVLAKRHEMSLTNEEASG